MAGDDDGCLSRPAQPASSASPNNTKTADLNEVITTYSLMAQPALSRTECALSITAAVSNKRITAVPMIARSDVREADGVDGGVLQGGTTEQKIAGEDKQRQCQQKGPSK